MLVVGIVLIARGHFGLLTRRSHATGGAAAFVHPAMAGAWLIRLWRPRGLFTAAWREGGRARRVLAVLVSATVIGSAIAWWQGFTTLCGLALVALGLSALALLSPLSRRLDPRTTPPDRPPTTTPDA
ncbi:hypothetical protein GCM10009665_69930 [Kitasatospora nipponensis]|uniref:Low temperature requirement A protein (LtrA) n=1 Tax=Kitasatospora nipponensis TaxID=258049 RepID=A0ABP4HR14_9ACTN